MNKIILTTIAVTLISCSHSLKQRGVAGVEGTESICEQIRIGADVLNFEDTKIGSTSDIKVLTLESTKDLSISNFSINGVYLPFIFATGGKTIFDDRINCQSLTNISICRIHLAFEPHEPGNYKENITLKFLANGKLCERNFEMNGAAFE